MAGATDSVERSAPGERLYPVSFGNQPFNRAARIVGGFVDCSISRVVLTMRRGCLPYPGHGVERFISPESRDRRAFTGVGPVVGLLIARSQRDNASDRDWIWRDP